AAPPVSPARLTPPRRAGRARARAAARQGARCPGTRADADPRRRPERPATDRRARAGDAGGHAGLTERVMRGPFVVVTSGFPRRSETFLLNELLALEERGALRAIFATKRGEDGPQHPPSARLPPPLAPL